MLVLPKERAACEQASWQLVFVCLRISLYCVQMSLYLKIYSSFVGQICFISCQSNNNIRAGLSLQLLHPVLRTCECILEKKRKKKRLSALGLYVHDPSFTCYELREQSLQLSPGLRNHQPQTEDKGQQTNNTRRRWQHATVQQLTVLVMS